MRAPFKRSSKDKLTNFTEFVSNFVRNRSYPRERAANVQRNVQADWLRSEFVRRLHCLLITGFLYVISTFIILYNIFYFLSYDSNGSDKRQYTTFFEFIIYNIFPDITGFPRGYEKNRNNNAVVSRTETTLFP